MAIIRRRSICRRPQPALIALLASGMGPVYPCHKEAKDMRSKRSAPGRSSSPSSRPTISSSWCATPTTGSPGGHTSMPSSGASFRALQLASWPLSPARSIGGGDLSPAVARQIVLQAPKAICRLTTVEYHHEPARQPRPDTVQRSEDPQGHDACARPEGLQRHHVRRQGHHRRRHAAAPGWQVGYAAEVLNTLPGYAGELGHGTKRRAGSWRASGYGPNNRLKVKVSTRDWAV